MTPTKTTKNMEHRQYGQPSWGNHTLHHPRSTNKRGPKKHTVPCYEYRKRGHHIRISLDGRIRASVHMEKWRHRRRRITHYSPVCESFYSQKRPDNRMSKRRRKPTKSHDLHRTRNQSATIHKDGGHPNRIPTICQGIQRAGIKAIPTQTSLGSRNRI